MSESDSSDTETPNPTQPNSNPINFPVEFAAQLAEFLKQSLSAPGATQTTKNQKPEPLNPKEPLTHPEPLAQPESLGDVKVKTKLDGDNYSLRINLMERAIGGKGLTSHISGVSTQPPITDPNYPKWQQRDHCVFNWIIDNIENNLVNEVSQYATARDLWEGLAITYGSGADPFQVFDLHRQITNIRQQGVMSLEALWAKLTDLWISIDRREPNPMSYPTEIEKYNQLIQRQRLYQFLTALDDRYDAVKREILNREPLPTARKAYGIVRRQSVIGRLIKPAAGEPKDPTATGIGSGLATANNRRTPQMTAFKQSQKFDEDKSKLSCVHCGGKKHTKETCFHLHGFPEWWDEMKRNRANRAVGGPWNRGGGVKVAAAVSDRTSGSRATSSAEAPGNAGAFIPSSIIDGDDAPYRGGVSAAVRSHGEGNFSRNIWTGMGEEEQRTADKERKRETDARVSKWGGSIFNYLQTLPNFAKRSPNSCPLQKQPHQTSFLKQVPHISKITNKDSNTSKLENHPNVPCSNRFHALANTVSQKHEKNNFWIFDCGATDTMSFDISDFTDITTSKRTYVQTANGDLAPVQGAGTIDISPNLRVSNCLYVPSLSHKLLSISHVTQELNCTLLMQPHSCILQDTRTGMIIGRGTERHGLYYVDEVAQQGTVMLTRGLTESQTWLWHRRLGHPSMGYLRLLFPNLASLNSFKCDTCFLAKSIDIPSNLIILECHLFSL